MSTALKKANRFKEIPSKIATPYLTKTDVYFNLQICVISKKKKGKAKPSVSSQAIFKNERQACRTWAISLCLVVWL